MEGCATERRKFNTRRQPYLKKKIEKNVAKQSEIN